MMTQAYICDAIRTPFGRYGGALSNVRTDDLAAIPLKALIARNPMVDWQTVTDVLFGCANQAGEDSRNVAHMASLLAGLPLEVPGATLNRLCGSSLDAVGTAARAIKAGEATLIIAGQERLEGLRFQFQPPLERRGAAGSHQFHALRCGRVGVAPAVDFGTAKLHKSFALWVDRDALACARSGHTRGQFQGSFNFAPRYHDVEQGAIPQGVRRPHRAR